MDAPSVDRAELEVRRLVRDIPDFPKPGILFRDITPLIADREGLKWAVEGLARRARHLAAQYVVAPEARGFLLGPALALELDAGFILARKPGALPREKIREDYALEYATASLECHADALSSGARVLIHDDLLATGGTALALCSLVERLGGVVAGCGFLIELASLDGRERLAPRETHALITYDS